MNREIKFRGKRKKDSTWIYGSLCRQEDLLALDETVCIFPSDAYDSYDNYVVNEETVGQYTGLKDKNGVEIYEGDIMNDPTSKNVGIVVWNNILTQFQLSWQNMPTAADLFFMVKNGSLVIGNIHDNPELLNKEETE